MSNEQTTAEMAEEIKRSMRASLMSNKVEAEQSANVDRLAALASRPAAPALDDPAAREIFSAAIDGAMASGFYGTNPPPEGHWLARWWERGREYAPTSARAESAEPVAWMWQQDETGRTGFVDCWQVENGWQQQNPRLRLVHALYAAPRPAATGEPVAWLVGMQSEPIEQHSVFRRFPDGMKHMPDFIITPLYAAPRPAATEDLEFKNFHRLLCERFGYSFDPVHWRRDQASLIEYIDRESTAPRPAATVEADEPFAWVDVEEWAAGSPMEDCFFRVEEDKPNDEAVLTPLHLAAPRPDVERKPLTDEQLDALAMDEDGLPNSHLEFARAIERFHGITKGQG